MSPLGLLPSPPKEGCQFEVTCPSADNILVASDAPSPHEPTHGLHPGSEVYGLVVGRRRPTKRYTTDKRMFVNTSYRLVSEWVNQDRDSRSNDLQASPSGN